MANVIAKSMYSECNDSGNEYLMMDLIVDYRKNDKAITVPDKKVVHIGRKFMRRSTIRWNLYVQWRDYLTSWQALKDLKDLHTVDK